MICKKCGKQIEEDSRFCPECGTAQFGDEPADSEFGLWRKKNINIALYVSLAGIVIGITIRLPQVVVLSALIFMIAAFKLNNLKKRDK